MQQLLKIDGILFYITMGLYLVTMALYFVFFVIKKEKLAKVAGILMTVAFAVHTLTLILRGIGAGRLPLTNQFEFACSFAWGISLCTIVFIRRFRFEALGTFINPVIFILMGYAAMQSMEVKALMPALQSNWLSVHVCSSIIAYGAFGVAFAVSLMYLIRDSRTSNPFWQNHIPECKKLDMINYRAVSLGILFLTFTIITGAIWGEQAWGSYWNWDPKETWALITWIIYALYLHQRIFRRMNGKAAALYVAIGFICVLFTYVGVNTLLPGVHSYA